VTAEPGPAQLDIAAVRHRGATVLSRRRLRWPYVLTTPLRLDTAPADMLTVMVQSASGAITAGDRLGWSVTAGPGAALHVTTQAATAVHAMPAGRRASESLHVRAAAGSFVEILPEPLILFPGATLRRRGVLVVDAAATVLLAEGFLGHDPVGAGRPFAQLAWETEVRRPDGSLLLVDRADVAGTAVAGEVFGAHGSLLLLAPPVRLPPRLLAELDAALALDGVYAGAFALPADAGVGLRCVARDGRLLRAGLHAAWSVIRTALTGVPGGARRGKSTV
jgi:urease accessory protein